MRQRQREPVAPAAAADAAACCCHWCVPFHAATRVSRGIQVWKPAAATNVKVGAHSQPQLAARTSRSPNNQMTFKRKMCCQ